MKINVMSDILKANDLLARDIERLLQSKSIVAWNIMGSPGSGKTTVLEAMIPRLPAKMKAAVIEGDIATSKDAERIAKTGAQSTQINTDGACHLDAAMVRSALDSLDLDAVSIIFIENVGNLVCPAGFALGEKGRIIVSSVTEGEDKPEKYPSMFKTADLVVLNKVDLIEGSTFNLEEIRKGMEATNPDADIIHVSALKGTGIDDLINWIVRH